jgi:hypothetical protein
LIAPALMMLVFTGMFIEFGRFSSKMNETGMVSASSIQLSPVAKNILTRGTSKVAYAETTPKLFASITNEDLVNLPLTQPITQLQDNQVILGFEEATMMQKEKLFTNVGDNLPSFFGLTNVKVIGILKSTGTPLDNYHLVSQNSFNGVKSGGTITMVNSGDEWKYFYFGDTSRVYTPVKLGSVSYLPIAIGSKEAALMQQEKLFKTVGDRLENLFGNKVMIIEVIPETNTLADSFHYVGPEFSLLVKN